MAASATTSRRRIELLEQDDGRKMTGSICCSLLSALLSADLCAGPRNGHSGARRGLNCRAVKVKGGTLVFLSGVSPLEIVWIFARRSDQFACE
jgi:hypothetical protein